MEKENYKHSTFSNEKSEVLTTEILWKAIDTLKEYRPESIANEFKFHPKNKKICYYLKSITKKPKPIEKDIYINNFFGMKVIKDKKIPEDEIRMCIDGKVIKKFKI